VSFLTSVNPTNEHTVSLDKQIQDVSMKKDFTIEAEVRLFAHWNTPMDSPEEWERRKAVDDRLGVIACDLDEVVSVLAQRQAEEETS
jgi:hypothetical protein